MSTPREMYANTLARFGTEAFEYLESEHSFVRDEPWISAPWNAVRLVYRGDPTFVVVDMAPREATLNVCLGRLVDGRLPPYPIFRPADSAPLEWIPIWALAMRDGETVEQFRFPGPDRDQLRAEFTRWSALLRAHGAPALAGDPISADGSLLPPRKTPADLSRQGEKPQLIVGQSQMARVHAFAQETGSSVFQPKDAMDDKPFLQLAASFLRGALQKGIAIRDIGPDPLVLGDGGFLYSLWRGLIQRHAGLTSSEQPEAAAQPSEDSEQRPTTGSPETYRKLRTMALDAVRLGLPAPPPEHSGVSGAVIDVPAEGGFVTLVAMGEGTTSMYTSVGGGTIGAGGHPPVAAATHALLSTLNAHLADFDESDDQEHPPRGNVRFFALTPSGRRIVDIPEDAFWGRMEHPLMPVVMAAQGVITELGRAPGTKQ